jgi:hypothetical protein
MDRPLRSVLDIRIGTIVKAYFIYLAIGLVVFLVGLVVMLSYWHSSSHGASTDSASVLAWSSHAGDAISDTQYRSVRTGSTLATVRTRFGTPASNGPNPTDKLSGDKQRCFGYRSGTNEGMLYVLCFANDRLVAKQTW